LQDFSTESWTENVLPHRHKPNGCWLLVISRQTGINKFWTNANIIYIPLYFWFRIWIRSACIYFAFGPYTEHSVSRGSLPWASLKLQNIHIRLHWKAYILNGHYLCVGLIVSMQF